MQKKVKKFISGLAVLGLSLGSLPMASADGLAIPQFTQAQVLPAQIKIVVTEAKLAGSELTVQAGQASSVQLWCQTGVSQSGLVQGQTIVNLNQPVSCFNSITVKNLSSQAKLSVKSLYRIESRVVVLPSARISSVYYSQAPSQPILSQAPIPVSAVLMIFMAAGFGAAASKFKKTSLSAIKQALSLEQLQIMRC